MPNNKVFSFFYFIIIVALSLMAGCNSNEKPVDEFIIHGKLKNTLGEKIVLQQLKIDSLKPIDSVNIDDNGEFIFKHKPQGISFYLLKVSDDNFITLLADKGEKIEITGDLRQLANEYNVTGSDGSTLLCEFNTHTRENYRKTDSLYKVQTLYQDSTNYVTIKKNIDSVFETVFADQQQYNQKFIQKNRTSLSSLIALYQVFGRQKVLNERDHFSIFKLLDSTLFMIYPQNDYVLELHTRVKGIELAQKEKLQNLALLDSGRAAPDIKMKNIGGFPQNLSTLKGRYTLVLFWAASSQPSIKSLDSYKWIYKKYRDKGFQVYAVSFDKDRRTWEYGVRENHLSWINVSDLLGWNSPVVKDYSIDTIPHAILIDRDGRILKRGIGSDMLAGWLNKIYKF